MSSTIRVAPNGTVRINSTPVDQCDTADLLAARDDIDAGGHESHAAAAALPAIVAELATRGYHRDETTPAVFDSHAVGCLIDGHRGVYAHLDLIAMAVAAGWRDAGALRLSELGGAANYPDALDDDDRELALASADVADDAEGWLNDHCAMPGHAFGWSDGEFFYQLDAWWEETY